MTAQLKSRQSSAVRNFAIMIGVVAVLYAARDLLIPLAFAIVLSILLAPAVGLLQKLRIGRVPAALFVILVAAASAGAVGWVIFNDFVDVAIGLPQYRENINKKLTALNGTGSTALGRAADSVKELSRQIETVRSAPPSSDGSAAPANPRKPQKGAPTVDSPMPVQVVQPAANELDYARDLLKPIVAPLAICGMVLIFTLYLLIEYQDLRNRIFRLAGIGQLNLMTQALDDATSRVSRYLMLQLLVNLCYGAICGTGLYLIGVPYAALWGALAAILRIVPYVGPIIGLAMPLILSLAVFDGWKSPVMVGGLFVTTEVVTGNFVEPWLYGIHTGISSLALLLSTVFWAAVWGPAGLILSTPLTVCVVVLGRYVPQFAFLHVILGDNVPLAAEAQIYQRLLALDEQEARVVADQYLKDHSLAQLYDGVLIPALTLAEQDRHKGALDQIREEFLFLSVKEMLADLPDHAAASDGSIDQAALVTSDVKSDVKSGAKSGVKSDWPTGRTICVPANDEADEICAVMLSQLLELAGCINISFPVDSDLLHHLESLEPSRGDVIFISALPPFALSHAKALSRQIRGRFPQVRVIVGVWGFTGDVDRALERFHSPRPDRLVTTMEQAVASVLARESAPVPEPAPVLIETR